MINSGVFSRIVVGVDGSAASMAALRYAARLTRDHDGKLTLCDAVDSNRIVAQIAGSAAVIDTVPIVDSLRRAADTVLHDACAIAAQFGVTAEYRSPDADPAEALLAIAHDENASLIVMGTLGRSGIERFFVGSTTEAVVRRSTVPVLTVGHLEAPERESRRCIERVLLALDDSEPSDAALDLVCSLPAADRSEVLVYSVAEIEAVVSIRNAIAYERAQYERAREIVDRAKSIARAHDVTVRGFALEGHPEDVIVDAAKSEVVDLIVVGSHGRRGLQRFFLGSVAEHILRTATVPTLVVRAPLAHANNVAPVKAAAPGLAG